MPIAVKGAAVTIRFHDVSHFQTDYQPIGPTFAKATEGTGYADTGYAQTKARTIAGGWPFAAYHFLHHGDIAAQAAWAYQHIGNTPAMLDVEHPKSGADPDLADVTGFIDAYRRLGGILRLVYWPHWHWSQMGSPSLQPLIDRGCALISSDYTAYSDTGPGWAPYGGMTPAIWQYTDSPIDTNAYRGTVAQLLALIGGSMTSPTMTTADAVVLAHSDGVINNTGGFGYRQDSPSHVPPGSNTGMSLDVALQSIAGQARAANVNAAAALAAVAGLAKSEAALQATLDRIAAGGTSLDTAALAAQIKAVGDATTAEMAALQQTVTDLEAKLAAAVAAEAAALAVK